MGANRQIGTINFTGDAANYVIGGTFVLAPNNAADTAGIRMSGLTGTNAIQTFNAPIRIDASDLYVTNNSTSGTGAGAGTFILNGPISGKVASGAQQTLRLVGSNTNLNTISGVIADGSGGSFNALNVVKSNVGTWKFSGVNTFTGTFSTSAGTLVVGVDSVDGVGGAFGNNAAVNLGTSTAATTVDMAGFNTSMGSLVSARSDASITTGGGTLTVGGRNVSGTFAGAISGTGGFTKIGTATQTLSGANSYTGPTEVSAGKLVVTFNRSVVSSHSVSAGAELYVQAHLGGSPITVGGLLSGNSINGNPIGAVTMTSTGTISPGSSTGALGNLAIGSLTGTTGAVLSLRLGKTTAGAAQPAAPADYTRIGVTGGSVLLNNMTLDLKTTAGTGNIQEGDLFLLINNSGSNAVQGTFAGLAQGSEFEWEDNFFRISYTANWNGTSFTGFTGGNDVALLVIPEPNTWAMLIGGFGMLLSFQRLRSKRVGTR